MQRLEGALERAFSALRAELKCTREAAERIEQLVNKLKNQGYHSSVKVLK